MKIIFSLFLLHLFIFNISAQESNTANPSDLLVIKKQWYAQKINRSINTVNSSEAIDTANSQIEYAKSIVNINAQNKSRATRGLPPLPQPSYPKSSRNESSQAVRTNEKYFVYEINVKNIGEKNIRSFTWAYILFNDSENKEIGRREFTTVKTIHKNKKAKVLEGSTSPLSLLVNASQTGADIQSSERIIIKEILYSDGSVWKAKSN